MENTDLKSKFRMQHPSPSKTHFFSPHEMAKNKSYNWLEMTCSKWVQTVYRFIIHASKSSMWISMFLNHFSPNLSKDSLYGIHLNPKGRFFLIYKFYCLSFRYTQYAPLLPKRLSDIETLRYFNYFMNLVGVIWGQNEHFFKDLYSTRPYACFDMLHASVRPIFFSPFSHSFEWPFFCSIP